MTRHDKTREDKTRQDKTRQDKTRQDKTRQDKTQTQIQAQTQTQTRDNSQKEIRKNGKTKQEWPQIHFLFWWSRNPPTLSPCFTFPFHFVSQPNFLSPQDHYLFRLPLVVFWFFFCFLLFILLSLCFLIVHLPGVSPTRKRSMRKNRMVGGRGYKTRATSAGRKKVRHCPHDWVWKGAPEGR